MNEVIKGDCVELIQKLKDNSVNAIITDPPYLYLNHKLDRSFNEDIFFKECKRILKDDGFIVLFGRGTSFYRWNTMLDSLGFKFLEEIIWNKRQNTSPLLSINRVHETISIYTKGSGIIRKVHIPYIKSQVDIVKISNDVNRILSELKNSTGLKLLHEFLDSKIKLYNQKTCQKHKLTTSVESNNNRAVIVLQSIEQGKLESSIIEMNREHYEMEHPTQKPIDLMERLVNLVTNNGDVVLDPFAGSGSTLIACQNLHRNFIGFEIDEEYYNIAVKRLQRQLTLDIFD